jgi:DNA-binding MarR family transcriptional regulator
MSKSTEVKAVAQEIVKVIPQVMRTIGAERHFSGHTMSPAHLRLLTILASHPCNLSELAVRHAVSLPTMSNSISVLVERGWVNRVPSPGDRRQILLELTPDGRTVLIEIKSRAEARVAEVLGKLSSDDLASLSAGLTVLEQAFAFAMCPRPHGHVPLDKVKRVSRE